MIARVGLSRAPDRPVHFVLEPPNGWIPFVPIYIPSLFLFETCEKTLYYFSPDSIYGGKQSVHFLVLSLERISNPLKYRGRGLDDTFAIFETGCIPTTSHLLAPVF